MPITLQDVALKAGVSAKTVSRVINNQGEISETTRQRILQIIDELGYRPNALARSLKDRLSESELRTAYENRKSEFEQRSNPERGDLPTDLFAGQPELTPAFISPFEEVRSTLAYALAEEKAQAEIADKFAKIKDDVLIPFADKYQTALTDNEDAAKQGSRTKVALPEPSDLKELAKREGLTYELTPMLSREEAERYGQISGADDPSKPLLNGRVVIEEVLLQTIGAAAHDGGLNPRFATGSSGDSVTSHADGLQADAIGVYVGARLQIVDHGLRDSLGIRWKVQIFQT